MHRETQPLTDWKQHTLTNTSSEQRFSRIEKVPDLRPPYIQSHTFPHRRFCFLTWAGFNFHMRVKSSSCTRCVLKQEKSLTFTSFQCRDLCDKQNSRYRSERRKRQENATTGALYVVCNSDRTCAHWQLFSWGKELIRNQLELCSLTGRFCLRAPAEEMAAKEWWEARNRAMWLTHSMKVNLKE